MGKSDAFIFQEYVQSLQCVRVAPRSVAFLGFPEENAFTACIQSPKREFFDLSLGNWNINSRWELGEKFDLLICTRCAYFSSNPVDFIERCKNSLNPGGHALIDWGLGDHWRFPNYKIGWVRDGEHEYAYLPENKLHSCFWKEELINDPEVEKFWKSVKVSKSGIYGNESNIHEIVTKEVPHLINYECKSIRTKFLWPEDPQLYIITVLEN